MSETPTATPAPAAQSEKDRAQALINGGYTYMDASLDYANTLKRFARNNQIAPDSAEYQAIDRYFRSFITSATEPMTPPELSRFAPMSGFGDIRAKAQEMATANRTFAAELNAHGGAYATNAATIIGNIDRFIVSNPNDDENVILDNAIDQALGAPGTAMRVRNTGWPEGVEQSYEAGRGLRDTLRDFRNAATNGWDSMWQGASNFFNGGGGNSNGGVNFNLGGILGGLGGGIGGFMIGKLFGGGIFGTIASIFLGVFGAYLGASTFGRGGSNNNAGAGTGTGDASASPAGAAAVSGERNIPMRGADGSVRYVSPSEHEALLNSAAGFSGNVRYNPSRGEDPCPPTYRGRQSERFQPAY
jgi:hypothetical protein